MNQVDQRHDAKHNKNRNIYEEGDVYENGEGQKNYMQYKKERTGVIAEINAMDSGNSKKQA